MDDTFKSAEMRVAAYLGLTAEQGRALYAAYVKRGAEVDRLRGVLAFAEKNIKVRDGFWTISESAVMEIRHALEATE
jgi:hypothetical protein